MINVQANVSRETLEKLREYEALVRKWSSRINLVSRNDLDDLWRRHIEDSVQIADLSDAPDRWMDLGAGGGFPGMVVAIMLADTRPEARVTLVESDKRKCAFLATVRSSLGLPLDIVACRVETLEPSQVTTVSARAMAPLDTLAAYAARHLQPQGVALFPKGKGWKNEVAKAKEKWSFDLDVIESVTDPDAAVLRLRNIQRQ